MLEDRKDFMLHTRLNKQFAKELFEHCEKHENNVSTFVREALEEKLSADKKKLEGDKN